MLPCNSLDRSEDLVINSRLLRHWTDIVFNLKQVPELPMKRGIGIGFIMHGKGITHKKPWNGLGKSQADLGNSWKMKILKLPCSVI